MDNRKLISPFIAAMVALTASPAWASYAIYVGKNLTSDGSVFIGGTRDEPSSHWLEIVPRKNHTAGETISVGVTKEANYPGEQIEIPQVPVTATRDPDGKAIEILLERLCAPAQRGKIPRTSIREL
jgi:hypothetical protein